MKKFFTFLLWSLCLWTNLSVLAQSRQLVLPFPTPSALQHNVAANHSGPVVTGSARTVASTIRYVKAGAEGDGSSWSNASGDLQAMINASASGDQVWVARGTYMPSISGLSDPRTASFSNKNGVSVLGGFTGIAGTENNVTARSAIPSSTTLSGDIGTVGDKADNCYHVILNNSNGLDNSAVLDGFVITGGKADGASGELSAYGGGIFNIGSSPSILNCLFTQNSGITGASIANAFTAGLRIANCSFVNNVANQIGGIYDQNGDGTSIVNCFFGQNSADVPDAAFRGNMGTMNVINCTFSGNTPGAFRVQNNTTVNLVNSLFWNNGGQDAIHVEETAASLNASYCLIEANETDYTDGGHNQTLNQFPFANVTGPQLSLCAPAVDAGNDAANTTTTDVLGNARKLRTIDIGAAEYQGEAYVSPTITSTSQSATTVCVGTTVHFNYTVSLGSGGGSIDFYQDNTVVSNLFSGTTNTSISSVYSLPVNQSGSYRLVVTGACTSLTSTYASITANSLPTSFSVTGGGPYCAGSTGSTVGLSGSQSGVNYQLLLEGNPTGNVIPGTNNPISFGPQSTTGTYTVQAVTTTSCSQTMSGSAVVSVNAPPLVSINPSATTICAGQSTALTATPTTGLTYKWSTGETTASISVSLAGPYSLTGTNTTTGCSNTATATLTVQSAPTNASLTGGTLTCATTSVTLTASATGGNSYTLSDGQINNTGQFVVNQPGSYTVTIANVSGCTTTATALVSQDNTLPSAAMSPASATLTCASSTVQLVASGGSTYLFSNGASQPGGPSSNTATVSQAGVYSVTVIAANGCSATASSTVIADQTPPTISINPSSATLTCANPTASLSAVSTGSVHWSNGSTESQIQVSSAGSYSVTATAPNGCTASTSILIQQDNTPPTVSISPSSATLSCASPSVSLTAVGTGAVRWDDNSTNPVRTVSASGTYSVTLTSTNGCTATASAIIGQDDTAPSVSITPSSATLTCANPTVSLTAIGTGTLQWSTGSTQSLITASAADIYSVTLTGGNGCTATASASITADQSAPDLSISPATATLTCTNPSATLTAVGAGSYHWSTGSNDPQIIVSSGDIYSVTLTAANGCTATASATVSADQSAPLVSISPSSVTLTCESPSKTLTAQGSGSFRWNTGSVEPQISVTTPGLYSVTLTSGNGCSAVATSTVESNSNLPIPVLVASATSTANQPISVTASGCSGTLNWSPQGGTGQAIGDVYTFTQPGNYTLSASCTVGACTSPASTPITLQILPGGFAITAVIMVNCTLIDEAKGGYQVQFTPQYSGQNSNPISFSVVNEMPTTTASPPYSLKLYTDNPVITLVANQAGNAEARFAYNWFASCQSGTDPNQAPTTSGIPNQTILVGQAYQLNLNNYFSDPDGQSLTYSATGLPAGLSVNGTFISGTPSTTGVSSVQVTALDPGGLSAQTSFQLTVNPAPTTPSGFTIVGVSTVSCEVVSPGLRRVTFTPQYGGSDSSPISFSVVNEMSTTTNPGPYSLNLYTDNPSITLTAKQGASLASYLYNWLAACSSPARVGTGEAGAGLQVKVLGNPIEGKSVEVEIRGVMGQAVQLDLVDMQGKVLHQQRLEEVGSVERVSVPVGTGKGLLLLQVNTAQQHQQVKLLKP
ncbi:hypothetical protein G8759_07700 [Spirosoma aureum]|uniref:Ig-like domain-containing protein n=1 Tax=Spirosoma aureum TaxID=2692134 RepID=A0A6G9AJJ7_9BACT|nr:putative Ig domain-containing protein [Spirosoma aureum]QIP12514.1 hypothetical protein G8759_07700 [Spirosoma aureum]